jgi:hypothetical protein
MRTRILVVAAAAGAIGWVITFALLRPSAPVTLAAIAGLTLLALATAVGYLRLLLATVHRWPARLMPQPGRGPRTAPSPVVGAAAVALLVVGAGTATFLANPPRVRRDPSPPLAERVLDTTQLASRVEALLLTGLLAALLVAVALAGRPYLLFTPEALVIREAFGDRRIPWAALRPGLPARPSGAQPLILVVDRLELVRRRGLTWGGTPLLVPTIYGRVHPGYLADTIRHYVDRPQERAALGVT